MFFVIFAPNYEAADRLLDDVKKANNVLYIRNKKEIMKLNQNLENTEQVCFLYFNPWTDWAYKCGFVEDMKNKFKKSLHIVFLLDVYAARKLDIEGMKKKFTEIFIFDKLESKRLGISYYANIYSKIFTDFSETVSDVCFVGQAKNRYSEIINVFEKLNQNNIKCDFYIVGVELENQKYKDIIKYGNFISYEEACSYIKRSKCILEIKLQNCNSYSNRVMEAIANNKKILTNNKNIKELPFYNEKWMQIYDNAKNINTNFLKEKINVDYQYNNEFSPLNFLKFIEKRYGN